MKTLDKTEEITAIVTENNREQQLDRSKNRTLQGRRIVHSVEHSTINHIKHFKSLRQKKIFVAICNKYKVETFRYSSQKQTTVVARIGTSVMDGLLWPEFEKLECLYLQVVEKITKEFISHIHEIETEEKVIPD